MNSQTWPVSLKTSRLLVSKPPSVIHDAAIFDYEKKKIVHPAPEVNQVFPALFLFHFATGFPELVMIDVQKVSHLLSIPQGIRLSQTGGDDFLCVRRMPKLSAERVQNPVQAATVSLHIFIKCSLWQLAASLAQLFVPAYQGDDFRLKDLTRSLLRLGQRSARQKQNGR